MLRLEDLQPGWRARHLAVESVVIERVIPHGPDAVTVIDRTQAGKVDMRLRFRSDEE